MATIKKRFWSTKREREAARAECRKPVKDREAWVVRYADQEGTWRMKTFRKKADAMTWQTTALHQVQQGTHTPDSTSITVAEAADLWLARCESDGLEHATMTGYRSHVTYHIKTLLGAEKVSRLTTPRIEQFRYDLLSRGERSRALAKKVVTSLKAILKEAQRRGLVAHNVARDVAVKVNARHIQRAERGKDIPTPEEIKALLAKVQGRWRPLLVTAIFTGLRSSELRGLTWGHVDFKAKVIRVRQRADQQGRIGALKSATSRRDIPMSPTVVNTLKEWKLACPRRGVKKDGDGNVIDSGELHYVFPNTRGNVESHANIVQRGVGTGLHRYRHFFASWLIDQGFGPKLVQALMGHASIQMTFDVYGHLFPQEDDHDKFAAGELALVG